MKKACPQCGELVFDVRAHLVNDHRGDPGMVMDTAREKRAVRLAQRARDKRRGRR